MMLKPGTVRVVYADKPGIYEVPVEQILVRREGDMIIISGDVLAREGRAYLFPNLRVYDPVNDVVVHQWEDYVGKGYPKVVPKYEVVEDAPDYTIVRRYDGQLFKVTDNFTGEILGNIYINPGKSLWDIIILESLIEAKRNPEKYMNEDYRAWHTEWVVYTLGTLAYICDLIELKI